MVVAALEGFGTSYGVHVLATEGAESFSLYDYGLIDGLDGTGGV